MERRRESRRREIAMKKERQEIHEEAVNPVSRLKKLFGVFSDRALAEVLGFSYQNINTARRRGTVSKGIIRAAAQKLGKSERELFSLLRNAPEESEGARLTRLLSSHLSLVYEQNLSLSIKYAKLRKAAIDFGAPIPTSCVELLENPVDRLKRLFDGCVSWPENDENRKPDIQPEAEAPDIPAVQPEADRRVFSLNDARMADILGASARDIRAMRKKGKIPRGMIKVSAIKLSMSEARLREALEQAENPIDALKRIFEERMLGIFVQGAGLSIEKPEKPEKPAPRLPRKFSDQFLAEILGMAPQSIYAMREKGVVSRQAIMKAAEKLGMNEDRIDSFLHGRARRDRSELLLMRLSTHIDRLLKENMKLSDELARLKRDHSMSNT